jgi:HlyD family secretion protein
MSRFIEKGTIVWGVVVAVIIAAAVWALSPSPILVDTATIDEGPMRATVDEEGKTRVKEIYVVSAPIAGRVLRSALEAGDAVERERSVVAIVQPTDPALIDVRTRKDLEAQVEAAQSAVRLAEAEVEEARSELAFAEKDLERARTLAPRHVVSKRGLEKAVHDVEVRKAALVRAHAGVEYRKRELASAKARLISPLDIVASPDGPPRETASTGPLCCVQVRAPAGGRVLRILAKSEQVVPAGTPLVEIGDPQDIEIVVEMLSTDAVKIREGAGATIEGWGGTRAIPAVVTRIEPGGFTKISALGIEEQRVRVILDFKGLPEAWRSLGHDFRVYARVTSWESDRVIRVPLSALFRQGDEWAVFRTVDDRAELTIIDVGHRNREVAEVLSGLKPGDCVVLHPSDRVHDGVAVAERPEASSTR